MTVSAEVSQKQVNHGYVVWLAMLALGVFAATFDWGWTWPKEWVPPLGRWITVFFKWFSRDATIGGMELGALMRSIAKLIEWPMVFLQSVLVKGLRLSGFSFVLPWYSVLGGVALLAHWAGGWRSLLLVLATGAYLLLLGLWESAMMTMALVTTSVAVGCITGLLLGIAAWRNALVERIIVPIYDLLQVLPIFSYLLPIVVLFGFGPLSGLIATVVFAMPPMARVTTLALRKLPRSVFELADINGCTGWKKMVLVLLPSARTDLLVGLNQVVNLSFAVSVFAAIIGGGGLGNDLFAALKALRLGPALEAGIAITLLAIALDRLSRAIAARPSTHVQTSKLPFYKRHLYGLTALVLVALGALDATLGYNGRVPADLVLTSNVWFNDLVSNINKVIGEEVALFREWLVLMLLRPVKDALHAIPWSITLAVVAVAGFAVGSWRLATLLAVLLFLIVLGGYWRPAMTSLYLALLGAGLAAAIGFPLGLLGALSKHAAAVNDVLVDVIQTLPTFVYLVPVIMILGIGDVPALIAIMIYAIAPAIRFTQSGLLQTKRSVLEAADMSGCTKAQRLFWVQVPIARRDLLLGLNQTIIMAFGMLVVTAMVGTRGLEANTLVALGKIDTGEGLLAGLALVALTIICDRLIRGVVERDGKSGSFQPST